MLEVGGVSDFGDTGQSSASFEQGSTHAQLPNLAGHRIASEMSVHNIHSNISLLS